jgi:tungstate transport system permease protein
VELLWRALLEAVVLIVSADAELVSIALRSLAVSSAATMGAAVLAVPLGTYLGLSRGGTLQRAARLAVDTGMAVPPVLVGLLVLILFWRTGPFGEFDLLYTLQAMALAQGIVAFPLIAALTRSAVAHVDVDLVHAMRALGAEGPRLAVEVVRLIPAQLSTAVAAGFGRALAEVGASLMVGANIAGETRVLTTAITLEAGRGDFALAIALGLVLLLLALAVNALRHWWIREP